MDAKNFFKLTKAKVIILIILFAISIFVSPCSDWKFGDKTPRGETNQQIITTCSELVPSLLHPEYMVYDHGWPRVWGIFNLYDTQINFVKYLVIPFNLIIAYLLSCVIMAIYSRIKK